MYGAPNLNSGCPWMVELTERGHKGSQWMTGVLYLFIKLIRLQSSDLFFFIVNFISTIFLNYNNKILYMSF